MSRKAPFKLAVGSALFLSGRLSGAALTFLTQVLLARWMGSAEFGRYAAAFSATMVVSVICMLGIPPAALRVVGEAQVKSDHASLRGFVRRGRQLVLGAAFLAALLGVATLWITARNAGRAPSWPFVLAFLCIPGFAFLRLQSGLALAFSRFALSLLPNTVVRPAVFLAAISAVWAAGVSLTPSLAMGVQLAVVAAVAVGQSWMVDRVLRTRIAGSGYEYHTGEWMRIASPLLFVGLYANFYPELNVLLLSFYLPPEEVAVFHAAFRTAFLIGFGIVAVDSMTMPVISRLYAAGDLVGMQRVVRQGTLIKFLGSALATGVLAIWGGPILELFGEEFSRGYPVLMVLAVAQLVRATAGPLLEILNVTGHQDTSLVASLTCLVATIVAIAIVAPRYGIEGAGLVALSVAALSSLWLHSAVLRKVGVRASILGASGPV